MRKKIYTEKIYAKNDQKSRIYDLQSYLIQSYFEAFSAKSLGKSEHLSFCEIGERCYFNDGMVNEILYSEPKVVQISLENFGYPLPEVKEGTKEALDVRRNAQEIYSFTVPLISFRDVSIKVAVPTLANAVSRLIALRKNSDLRIDIITKHVYPQKIVINEAETISFFKGFHRRIYSEKTLYPVLPDKFHKQVLQLAAKGCYSYILYRNPFNLLVLNHPYYILDEKVFLLWRKFTTARQPVVYF